MELEEVEQWYEVALPVLESAAAMVERMLIEFFQDHTADYGLAHERIDGPRIKSAERVHAKCRRKGIDATDDLLSQAPPIVDLIGARLIARSHNDVASLMQALTENFAIELAVDDKNRTPSPTGYRAVHATGVLEVSRSRVLWLVPLELQVKTLLQDSWGTLTHADAYARQDVNQDARFARVRQLQHALAEQLSSADELQNVIEDLSVDAVHSILGRPVTTDLNVVNMLNLIKEIFGVVLRLPDGQHLVDVAVSVQLANMHDVRQSLVSSAVETDTIAGRFREQQGRGPREAELYALYLRHQA